MKQTGVKIFYPAEDDSLAAAFSKAYPKAYNVHCAGGVYYWLSENILREQTCMITASKVSVDSAGRRVIRFESFSERENPPHNACPVSILNQLHTTKHEKTLLWRSKCFLSD